jgi:protein subunit release factor A
VDRKPVFSVTKKDLEITYFSGHGAGGQHRNKHKNCVRIRHPETGVIVTGQEQRSLEQNKLAALKRLAANKTFKTWLRIQHSKALIGEKEYRKMLNNAVNKQMKPENLKIEFYTP